MNLGVLVMAILLIHSIWIYNFIYSGKIKKGLIITLINYLIAHFNAFIFIYSYIYIYAQQIRSQVGPYDDAFFFFLYILIGIPYFILHGFFLLLYLRKKKHRQSLL